MRDIEEVQQAIENIGSVQNLTLTELARNRRLLFVEGANDYKLIRRFAKILGRDKVAAGNGLTAIPSGGFGSWAKIKGLSWGLRKTLTSDLRIATVFDRDFRSDDEVASLQDGMREDDVIAHFHCRKEIENYLLCRPVLVRALKAQMRRKRVEAPTDLEVRLDQALDTITKPMRATCSGQLVANYCRFHEHSGRDPGTLASAATALFDQKWAEIDTRLEIVPGKRVLRELRTWVQDEYGITVTDFQILDAYRVGDVAPDMARLVASLDEFRTQQ